MRLWRVLPRVIALAVSEMRWKMPRQRTRDLLAATGGKNADPFAVSFVEFLWNDGSVPRVLQGVTRFGRQSE
jgi:hypothetical protein